MKNIASTAGLFLALAIMLAGCGGIQMKRTPLAMDKTIGRIIVDGRLIEPPYNIEIVKSEQNQDKYYIAVNGIKAYPVDGDYSLAGCDKIAKSIEFNLTSPEWSSVMYFIKGYDGFKSSTNEKKFDEVKAVLASSKSDAEKKIAVQKIVDNQAVTDRIMENNK